MTTTPGYRLVALKGLPRANPGLIINESYGFTVKLFKSVSSISIIESQSWESVSIL